MGLYRGVLARGLPSSHSSLSERLKLSARAEMGFEIKLCPRLSCSRSDRCSRPSALWSSRGPRAGVDVSLVGAGQAWLRFRGCVRPWN